MFAVPSGDEESSKTSSGEHDSTSGSETTSHTQRRGLKKPASFTTAPSSSSASTATGGVRTPNLPSGPHPNTDSSKRSATNTLLEKPVTSSASGVKSSGSLKMPSSSKLSHFSSSSHEKEDGARKIPSPSHAKLQRVVPRTTSASTTAAVLSDSVSKLQRKEINSSSSSLESFASSDIKLADSSSIDEAAVSLSAKAILDSKYTTPEKNILPPSSLEISQSAASSTSDLLSPPSGFKEDLSAAGSRDSLDKSHDSLVESHDKEASQDHLRYGRRISPEGMSHEEVKDSEDSSKKAVERNFKNEQEMEKSKERNMIIGDLDSHSKPRSDDTPTSTASTGDSDSHSNTENGNQTGKDEPEALVPPSAATATSQNVSSKSDISTAISQPETGQRYTMENMAQFKKPISVTEPVEDGGKGGKSSIVTSPPPPPTKAEDSHERSRLIETYPQGSHSSRIAQTSTDKPKLRARSLSPQRMHRVKPKTRVHVAQTQAPTRGLLGSKRAELDLARTASNDSTKSENLSVKKPLKSSLRNSSLNPKSRNSSSSSLESGKCLPKVTISPRSSQLVYDPEEIGLHPPSYAYTSRHSPTPLNISPDRPHSLTESAASSDSFSPPGKSTVPPSPLTTHTPFTPSHPHPPHTITGSTNILYPPGAHHQPTGRGGSDILRKRSAVSEKHDYRDDYGFLGGDDHKPLQDEFSSTPQVSTGGGGSVEE